MNKYIVAAAALLLFATGCESIAGSLEIDGEPTEVVNCVVDSAERVQLETADGYTVVLAKGEEGDTVMVGTGECLEEGWVSSCAGALGCFEQHWGCVRYDWTVYSGCSTIDLYDTDVQQGGLPVLDVEAEIFCEGGELPVAGQVSVSSCNAG